MRLASFALVVLSVLSLGSVACSPSIRSCAEGTVFVSVTLQGSATKAQAILVRVAVDGGAPVETPLAVTGGRVEGGIEIRFPKGYPAGKNIRVTIIAATGPDRLGEAEASLLLDDKCESLALTLGASTPPDLSVSGDGPIVVPDLPDLIGNTDDLTGSTTLPDLVGPTLDLIGNTADLVPACASSVEECFNGIDDDCDGDIDCADDDCDATAICVPPPTGAFEVGTIVGTTCPADLPDSTPIHAGLEEVRCGKGTCSCPSAAMSGRCSVALMNAGSASACGGGAAPTSNDGQAECVGVPGVSGGSYHYVQTTWLPNGQCSSAGSAATTAPASFATNTNFCSRPTVSSNGCAGANVCVPKFSGNDQCVIAEGAAQACPTGYLNHASDWFGGHDSGATCGCFCQPAGGGQCSQGSLWSDSSCATTNLSGDCNNASLPATVYLTKATQTFGGTCGGTAQATRVGTTKGTGAYTVCCLP